MLLALDVGNTETVIGVFTDDPVVPNTPRPPDGDLADLRHRWRVATVPSRTVDEFALLLNDLCRLSGVSLNPKGGEDLAAGPGGHIGAIAICSSVPAVTVAVREMVGRWFDLPLFVVEPGIRMGMAVLYDSPKDVGADRIVNAVGALDLYGAPAVVVDLGTSTNFDVVSPAGEYLGGVVAPGLEISMEALFSRTARLRRIELVPPPQTIGRSTVESMQSGAIFGHAAMIDGLSERIIGELGQATIILTGGLSGLVSPHLRLTHHLEPWLTLHGLRVLYDLNRPDSPRSRR